MKRNPAKPKMTEKNKSSSAGVVLETLDQNFFKRTAVNSDLKAWDRTWRDNNTSNKRAQ